MKDEFLYQFQKPPRRKFAAALYQRISKTMSAQTQPFLRSRLGYALTLFLLAFALTLAASPAARVKAAEFLQRIGVLSISDRPAGDPVFVASPSAEQLALANATATPIAPIPETQSPIETAIAQAGFQPFLSDDLPSGYVFEEVVAAEYIDDNRVPYGWGIFVTYRTPEGYFLSIHTNRFDGREQDIPMGGQRITDVTVNGAPGVWIEDLKSQVSAEISVIDTLLWENGDYVLAIQSSHLTLAEVLALAESLQQ